MGSLGLPATAMAVRSAFALLCFALLCGLAASSVAQSKTKTELKEGEVAGNQVLVEQALESRVARGTRPGKRCRKLKGRNKKKCLETIGNRTSKQGDKELKKMTKKEQKCKDNGGEWKKNKCRNNRKNNRRAKKMTKKECKKDERWNKELKKMTKKE